MSSDHSVSQIPVLFLKTRSQPHDNYHDCFTASPPLAGNAGKAAHGPSYSFKPYFIPVLEHTQNVSALSSLKSQLRSGELKRRYGGMIFTSQRAVEAWADVVHEVENDPTTVSISKKPAGDKDDPFADLELLTPFPLYVVGPATERALQTLSAQCKTGAFENSRQSLYAELNASVHGAHTGNGADLASFILQHYNELHRNHWFEYFEAPRLPFIPLLGMSSQNYGRKRLDGDDPRLRKKPLLFLVGEQRRDIIPNTLQNPQLESHAIEVDEVEVYRTAVMETFEANLARVIEECDQEQQESVRVVVVFSGQGSDVMLETIKYLDATGEQTEQANDRWWSTSNKNARPKWIVATIGPTTRDHLITKRHVEPDVCAAQPSPESLREGIETFLQQKL